MPKQPVIRAFFDEPTNTVSYLVADPATKQAAVIDPVLDYDHKSGEVDTRSVEAILKAAEGARLDGRVGTGDPRACRPLVRRALHQGEDRRQDRHRRAHQGRAAHLPADLQRDRSEDRRQRLRPSVQGWRAVQDRRVERRDAAHARATRPRTSPTRSRMPSSSATHCSCRITAPRARIFRAATRTSSIARSSGCWRCRPKRACSCATTTRRPAATPTPGRQRFSEQREKNVHVGGGKTEDEFVAMRTARDATLSAPTLLLPSIQVNIRAGAFPPAEDNGVRYLKIPVTFKADRKAGPSPA